MAFAFFWFLFSIAVGVWASNKGRSGIGWFVLSLVISPLLGLIFCAAVRDLRTAQDAPGPATHVKCPSCAEWVLPEASKCKHCGGALVPKLNYISEIQRERDDAESIKAWIGLGVFALICAASYFAASR